MVISGEWCYYRYMSGTTKKYTVDIRVRYAETDRMGVVYYGNRSEEHTSELQSR